MSKMKSCFSRLFSKKIDSSTKPEETSTTDKQMSRTGNDYDINLRANKMMKARFSYNSDASEDLSFNEGAVMEVLSDDGEWWYAKDVTTKRKGFIPKNYFVEINSLDEYDWYHGKIDRNEAERLLFNEPPGTFIIRDSCTHDGLYSVSVVNTDMTMKHYRIKRMDNGDFYMISTKPFKTLQVFVEFCKTNVILCCLLKKPCKKTKPTHNDLSRTTRDKWEIDRNLIQLTDKIGAGNFGEVWKGLYHKKITVAVKIMKPHAMQIDSFLAEAATMKQLRHPKLVRLLAICSDDPVYIITEFMSKGCLQTFLKQDAGRTLDAKRLVDYGAQIACGMQYIESKNFVHRDLASRNVLVCENNNVKIGDFGLAKMLTDDVYVTHCDTKLPVRWTSPEVYSTKQYGIKSDVWAFGILLIELFTYGELPYPGLSNAEVQMKVTGTYRHPKPSNCTPEMYELMLTCWNKTPSKRPTFEALFNNLDDFIVANELAYA